MRAVIQRVSSASVQIDGATCASVGTGLLVLVGIEPADATEDILWLSGKIVRLRIFDDPEGVMNLSVLDVLGDILVVSQFTLHASTKKGNRPSYSRSAAPSVAVPLYERLVSQLGSDLGRPVRTGRFGAHMLVSLVNSGPLTIFMDTKNRE